jgi:hypothetical protein
MAEEQVVLPRPTRIATAEDIARANAAREQANNAQQQQAQTDTDLGKSKEGAEQQASPVELTLEHKKALFKELGFEYNSDDDLAKVKERLNPKAPVELTAEQKATKELELDKRMMDVFTGKGYTVDQYVALKNVANANVADMSKAESIEEFMKLGLTKENAEKHWKEANYQIEIDALEQYDEETDEDFAKRKEDLQKKKEAFSKKLNENLSPKQKEAREIYNTLKSVIAEQDLQAQQERDYAAKASNHIQSMPRKLNVELGKLNDIDLAPVQIDIDEAIITEAKELFTSADKRKQTFLNEDGTLNYSTLSEMYVKAKQFDKGIKTALLEGQTRQVKEFQKVFPAHSASSIGVGSTPNRNTTTGNKIVGRSAPKVAITRQ